MFIIICRLYTRKYEPDSISYYVMYLSVDYCIHRCRTRGGPRGPLDSKVPHRANTKFWSEPPLEATFLMIFPKVRHPSSYIIIWRS